MTKIQIIKPSKQGFVTLTSVVVITSILLIASIGLSLFSTSELQNSFTEAESSRALALAEYCQEKAIYNLTKNSAYQGGETLTPDPTKTDEICNILPVTTYGEPTGAGDAEGSFVLTEKSDWEAGANSGTDLVSVPGDVKIDSSGGSAKLDLLAMYNADNSIIRATADPINRSKVIDNNLATAWSAVALPQTPHSWIIDLKASYSIAYIAINSTISTSAPGMVQILESADDITYNTICAYPLTQGIWNKTNSANECYSGHQHPFNARYLKLYIYNGAQPLGATVSWNVNEFEIYSTASQPITTATNISKANQMTPPVSGAFIVKYAQFTPNETSNQGEIKYRFRKSNWGGSWLGEWSAEKIFTGDPIDLSKIAELMITAKDMADAKYYINVESTFAKSVPTSDPALHDYTVKYITQTGAQNGPTICKLVRSEGKVTHSDNFYLRRLESNSCSLCPVSLDLWREVGRFN